MTRSRRNLQERDGKKRWILQEYTGSHRNMEAVFRAGKFRIFSGDFRPVPGGKHRKVIGMYRKKSGNFPAGILLPCSGDFRCIPAGTVPYSLIWVTELFINNVFSSHRLLSRKNQLTRIRQGNMLLLIRNLMAIIRYEIFSFLNFSGIIITLGTKHDSSLFKKRLCPLFYFF